MIGKLYRIQNNITGESIYRREYVKACDAINNMKEKMKNEGMERYSITIYYVFLDTITGEGWEEESQTIKGLIKNED